MWSAVALVVAASALLIARAFGLQRSLFSRRDRVLLIVSHPDDESMFFSPTVLSLTCFGVPLSVLCLSNGGAYGQGQVREQEMLAACETLKIPASQVTMLDNPELQDGMKTNWLPEVVSEEVHKAVQKYEPTKVVTFDGRGVSGHVNHVDTHKGVQSYINKRRAQGNTSLGFYMLESVNVVRKFSGLLDLPLSSLLLRAGSSHLVVNPSPGMGIRAMLQHRSQLAWYRLAFIVLSRYTMINTLQEMR